MSEHNIAIAVCLAILTPLATLNAQGKAPADPHAAHQTQDASLTEQLADLRARLARLEAALAQGHGATTQPQTAGAQPGMGGHDMMGRMQGMGMGMPSTPAAPSSGMQGMGGAQPMPGMQDMGAMMQGMGEMMESMGGMMSGQMGTMGAAGSPSAQRPTATGLRPMPSPMPGMAGKGMQMGMDMMGMAMGAAPQPALAVSALPGFPGASHIYHIGSSGFFLDHAAHLALTPEQQVRLNQIKEATLLEQATFARSVEQAEQDLWTLTAADAPDAQKVETKVREIDALRGDLRLAYIRAVGRAAEVLTPEQRQKLSGMPDAHVPAGKPAGAR